MNLRRITGMAPKASRLELMTEYNEKNENRVNSVFVERVRISVCEYSRKSL